jgi:predicted transcriptional regulator
VVAVQHQIPKSCQRVYQALLSGRKMRNIDLQFATGQSSADRMVRRLREACPGLVREEEVKGQAGNTYKVFWIELEDQGRLF